MGQTLREFFAERDIFFSDGETEGTVEATAEQIHEYLAGIIDGDEVDLSGATINECVEISGRKFGNFSAHAADFNDGIIIKDCELSDDLFFGEAYVYELLRFENVKAVGLLTMPYNLDSLMGSGGKVGLIKFSGNVTFGCE